jgi:hypothetical protein
MERPFSWSFTTAAPLLVDTRPFDGEFDVAADRPIEIRLHRDVDRSSAGASFRLFDAGGVAVAGTVETFEDGIRFKPAAPLQRGVRYRAVIEPGVSTISGATLNTKPFEWSFIVIGDLEVQQVEPAGDTRDVPTDIPRISVRFNHPVVPLVDVASTGGLPVAATVDPPVQGVARWIDTSTFVISPTAPLDPSTDYRVRVAAGLTDQTGGALRNEYVWSFRTIDPAVELALPQTDFASPTEPITSHLQPADGSDVAPQRPARGADRWRSGRWHNSNQRNKRDLSSRCATGAWRFLLHHRRCRRAFGAWKWDAVSTVQQFVPRRAATGARGDQTGAGRRVIAGLWRSDADFQHADGLGDG